jgi:hypothetical protein
VFESFLTIKFINNVVHIRAVSKVDSKLIIRSVKVRMMDKFVSVDRLHDANLLGKTEIENVRATEAQAGFRHDIDIQARKC